MPVLWTAKGQRPWLMARAPEFKAAQHARKGMKKFYKRTFRDFFIAWPNQDAEEYEQPSVKLTKKGKVSKRQQRSEPREVKKFATTEEWMRDRERKIRSWFYNYSAKEHRVKARIKFNISVGSAKRPKVLSEENLYSKKYYATRVKTKVDAELRDVDDSSMRIAITKRCLREAWKSETQAVKTEIRELRKKLLREKKVLDELTERIFSSEQNPDDIEPEEYVLTQGSLDEVVDEILNLLATRTGWAVSLNIGGPDMSKVNGDITVKTYHIGNPKGKQSFWTDNPTYDQVHAKPFREWCRRFFPESVRLRRAVDIDETKVNNPQALVDAGRGHGRLVYVDSDDTPEEVAAREAREAAEAAQREKGGGVETPARDQTEEEREEEEEGSAGADVGDDKGAVDEEGDKKGGSEEQEAEMEWIIENGVPVPIFVEKATGTRAPDRPSALQGPPPNNDQAPNPQQHVDPATTQELMLQMGHTALPTNFFQPPALLPQLDPSPSFDIAAGSTGEEFNWFPTTGNNSFMGTMTGDYSFLGGTMDFRGMLDASFSGNGGDLGMWTGNSGFEMGGMFGQGPQMPNIHVPETQTVEAENAGAQTEGAQTAGAQTAGAQTAGAQTAGLMLTDVGSVGVQGAQVGAIQRESAFASRGSTIGGGSRAENGGSGKGAVVGAGNYIVGTSSAGGIDEDVSGGKRKTTDSINIPQEPAQRSKRARQARQAQSEELPDWINEAKRHLEMGMKHEGWLRLVDTWHQFEKAWARSGMSQSGRMQAQSRPSELGPWLQAPRQYNTTPKIDNIHAFADQWCQWWVSVQPGCRKSGGGELPKPLTKNMDVTLLKKGGTLGMVVILIGLRWWATCEELADRWEQAVEDVANVFRRFTSSAAC